MCHDRTAATDAVRANVSTGQAKTTKPTSVRSGPDTLTQISHLTSLHFTSHYFTSPYPRFI